MVNEFLHRLRRAALPVILVAAVAGCGSFLGGTDTSYDSYGGSRETAGTSPQSDRAGRTSETDADEETDESPGLFGVLSELNPWGADEESASPATPDRMEASSAGNQSEDTTFPELSQAPASAEPVPESAARRDLTEGLVAASGEGQYMEETLRGGSEPAAAPPRLAPPTPERPDEPAVAAVPPAAVSEGTRLSGAFPAPPDMAEPGPATELEARRTDVPANPEPPTPQPAPQVDELASRQLPGSPTGAPRVEDLAARQMPGSASAERATVTPGLEARALPPGEEKPSRMPANQKSGRLAAVAPAPEAPSKTVVIGGEGRAGAPVRNGTTDLSEILIRGGDPVVIYFAHGSSRLGSADLRKIRKVARLNQEYGGSVRVVGHASHRTDNMDAPDHILVNYGISVDRASAVAAALIEAGVSAAALDVEAKSDTSPVYYESMPSGEAGNRRVEIYLETP